MFIKRIALLSFMFFGLTWSLMTWSGEQEKLVSQPMSAEDKELTIGSASPDEVIAQVQAAAKALKTEADLAQFNEIEGNPWVWKDTYIFVFSCEKGIIAAHPIQERLIGADVSKIKDYDGKPFIADLCAMSKRKNGGWVQYAWPRPGEIEVSSKFSYMLQAVAKDYQVGAGIYDDNASADALNKMIAK